MSAEDQDKPHGERTVSPAPESFALAEPTPGLKALMVGDTDTQVKQLTSRANELFKSFDQTRRLEELDEAILALEWVLDISNGGRTAHNGVQLREDAPSSVLRSERVK